jgi:DNA-binding CsgD family transcriptional regulator
MSPAHRLRANLEDDVERRLELAAQGMTNKEIAQAQFVSARTVETHIGHVFQKLGLKSRKELAAALQAR